MINEHSDEFFVKGFGRYCYIDTALEANSWQEMENSLKTAYGERYQAITNRLFNEFKFYNYVLKIEYAVTDSLNVFFVENNLIKNWENLTNKFIEKIRRNERIKSDDEAKEIIEKEVDGDIKRILTPSLMLYCAGFGIGELIDHINSATKKFPKKKELINKLTSFNENRKILIHNPITSRENVESKIEEGIAIGKEIVDLIDEIIKTPKNTKPKRYGGG